MRDVSWARLRRMVADRALRAGGELSVDAVHVLGGILATLERQTDAPSQEEFSASLGMSVERFATAVHELGECDLVETRRRGSRPQQYVPDRARLTLWARGKLTLIVPADRGDYSPPGAGTNANQFPQNAGTTRARVNSSSSSTSSSRSSSSLRSLPRDVQSAIHALRSGGVPMPPVTWPILQQHMADGLTLAEIEDLALEAGMHGAKGLAYLVGEFETRAAKRDAETGLIRLDTFRRPGGAAL